MDLSDLMLAHRFVLSAPAFVCSAAVFKSRGLALKGLSRGPAVGEKARVCKAGLGSGYAARTSVVTVSKHTAYLPIVLIQDLRTECHWLSRLRSSVLMSF